MSYQPSGPGYPPAGPGYPPTGPGYPPAGPGYPPTGPGYPPATAPPGYGQGDAGYPPAAPGVVGYPPTSAGGYPAPGAYPPPAGYPPAVGYLQPAGNIQSDQPPQWMNGPHGASSCPPGLEYLAAIDQLLVHQKAELLEAFTGFETANKYTVKNSMGQKVYFAAEDNDCCTRNCCGPARPFDMKIMDNSGNEVIHLYRPLRCDSCLFPCCLQRLEVMSPPGTIIGYVTQEWSICIPKFRIENAAGECVLRIEGPLCTFSMCGDVEFEVLSKDGSVKVGKISKQWSGIIKEAFTDTDNFGINFPMDLDVNIKAVLLGATFLIDFMFFEKQGNKENDGIGML